MAQEFDPNVESCAVEWGELVQVVEDGEHVLDYSELQLAVDAVLCQYVRIVCGGIEADDV